MFTIWSLTAIAVGFLALLFAVGFWGDRYHQGNRQRPVIYSLALGVHCTSWAFYGTTAQSAQYGWAFTPTYVGSICVFLFGYPLLRRVIHFCQQNNISSVADFIGNQYGKSHLIAAIVTFICFIGVLPYTALQLDAVTASLSMLSNAESPWPGGISLYVAMLLALFAILFGTRTLSLTEKHPGLMLAIAFESVIKLAAFVLLGLFVCYQLFDGVIDLMGKTQLHTQARNVLDSSSAPWVYMSHMLLGMCSMFCLPRQFHINYVENNGEQELKSARWLFPLYLLAINLFVLPIALAGKILLPETSPDNYVIALPMLGNNAAVAGIVFIGGLAAASSMVIVATLAIGIMMANNLVTPLWLKLRFRADKQQVFNQQSLLTIRRLTVLLVVGLSYLYYQYLSRTAPLVNSGIIAMALMAQLAPSLVLGLYWQRSHKIAAILSILTGVCCWWIYLLWPSITSTYYFDSIPSDSELSFGVFISLAINISVYLVSSLILRQRRELQSTIQDKSHEAYYAIKLQNLLAVTERVFSPSQQQQLISQIGTQDLSAYASESLIAKIEADLAAHVGSASARILLSAITEQHQVPLAQLVGLVEEASQSYQFNHELLQSSVEHIDQGISVVDRHLKLLAWNQRYIQLFNYPTGFIRAGMPIEELLRFNARRGLFASNKDIDAEVAKRIDYLRHGSSYKYLRTQPDGRVIELQGNPMPGGGFVTTYSDMTDYVRTQQLLEESKSQLELRVAQRTEQLERVNQALEIAKQEAEQANDSKTKFLAAAGHDLMQPFNAATLFASMIKQQSTHHKVQELSESLLLSLGNAEELLSMLLDMTKLESGVLTSHIEAVNLHELLHPLAAEFSLQAQQKGLELVYVPNSIWVKSDRKLLKRVVQNLLSNAIRYTLKGKILIGGRRLKDTIYIQVHDTGVGIAKHQQQEIFNEFHQLDADNRQGLGLGLTIVERICSLLHHPVTLRSELGKGTCFSVQLSRCKAQRPPANLPVSEPADKSVFLHNKQVLIIDNETQNLHAMQELFSQWGANVFVATNLEQAQQLQAEPPDLLLVDYHLDHNVIGVDVATQLMDLWHDNVPVIVNSADYNDAIKDQAIEAGFTFLPKPLKTAALKRAIKKLFALNNIDYDN
ncbi:PAS domain-containing hybrid sensor histidine kinase/response regulator [Neptunicella marina]|uniref:histidine kinase n=1 Tax=Neptunicella marina TaxID=2125989 RepID=A0A8J6M0E1_9ALTE|nr:PAS domain-containing hybrid sensor histidine kinase/response regulator [Neptunicella marina]MBC3764648.1 PAS-domain containing protein [Neptunicella marina]